jgi:hypothetical protein
VRHHPLPFHAPLNAILQQFCQLFIVHL